MVLCLIPVALLVMLPDLLRSLQYLQPFLLQNGSPLSFLVVPWCVLVMSPVERDPEAVTLARLPVEVTGVMFGLTNSNIDLCRGCCLAPASLVVSVGGSGGGGAT